MAKNVEITGVIPEMYQENIRPAESFDFDELNSVGEPFGGFITEVGDIWRFASLEAYKTRPELRKKQRVQRQLRPNERPTYTYNILAERERNGVKTLEWFSLNFLNKTDADRKPANASWYKLGHSGKRLAKLCEMGEIKVTDTFKISVPIFQGGRPNRVPTLDPTTKEQLVSADGTAMTHVETRQQDAYHITPVADVVVTPAKPVDIAPEAAAEAQ